MPRWGRDEDGKRWCHGDCGRLLPATLEFFSSTGYRYLTRTCKRCRAIRANERNSLPTIKARIRNKWRRYRQANADRISAYKRAWDSENVERKRETQREWYQRRGKQLRREKRRAMREMAA